MYLRCLRRPSPRSQRPWGLKIRGSEQQNNAELRHVWSDWGGKEASEIITVGSFGLRKVVSRWGKLKHLKHLKHRSNTPPENFPVVNWASASDASVCFGVANNVAYNLNGENDGKRA